MEEEEELREVQAASSSRAEEDPEVTQFYVNPIAKPIPHGRAQANFQDTISELNMHKSARNGLEVRTKFIWSFKPDLVLRAVLQGCVKAMGAMTCRFNYKT